jgi:hypothetical protein
VAAATNAAPRPRPIVSLSASPTSFALTDGTPRAITLTNVGTSRMGVRVGTAGLAVDLRGRPRLALRPAAGRNAAPWLRVRPRALTLPAGGSKVVQVAVHVPRRAQPGDHHAAVVFTSRPLERKRVGMRMRLAVRLSVRVPGSVRKRLVIRSLGVRPVGRARGLEVIVANRGNTTESLAGRVAISLRTRDRAKLFVRTRRELLPGRSGLFSAIYRGRHRGVVSARITIRGAGSRLFRVRL